MTKDTEALARRIVFKHIFPLHPHFTDCEMDMTLERERESDRVLLPSTMLAAVTEALTTPDTIGSHYGNGGGLDPAAGDVAPVGQARVEANGEWLLKGWATNLPEGVHWLYAHPPHPAPVDSDEAVRLLRGIVRLSEMGFDASMREPEEDGNYAVYTRAKAFLDGHPSSVALSEALRDIPDEVYRHIAESKDVGNARSRVADLVAQLPLTTPVEPVAGGEALREALRRARDYLLEVGNDYPGSSCQKWCAEKATEIWNTLKPWEHCPSTHCERAQQCRSPNECSANTAALKGPAA